MQIILGICSDRNKIENERLIRPLHFKLRLKIRPIAKAPASESRLRVHHYNDFVCTITRRDTNPINYVYRDEVPISTAVTQRTPKVILNVVQDAQQLFDGSDKDLTALDTC